jgi:hypothetical protein
VKRIIFLLLLASACFGQSYHSTLKTANMHTPYRWQWADSAARVAQSITNADTMKFGIQTTNNLIYCLVDSPAVWKIVGGPVPRFDTAWTTQFRVSDSADIDTLTAARAYLTRTTGGDLIASDTVQGATVVSTGAVSAASVAASGRTTATDFAASDSVIGATVNGTRITGGDAVFSDTVQGAMVRAIDFVSGAEVHATYDLTGSDLKVSDTARCTTMVTQNLQVNKYIRYGITTKTYVCGADRTWTFGDSITSSLIKIVSTAPCSGDDTLTISGAAAVEGQLLMMYMQCPVDPCGSAGSITVRWTNPEGTSSSAQTLTANDDQAGFVSLIKINQGFYKAHTN